MDMKSANPEPIAIYAERLLEVRRVFMLYDDRVVVQARWLLKGRFEHVVKLATLQSEIHELTIRYRMYRYAGWVMALGGLLFVVAYYLAHGGSIGIMGNLAMGMMILGTGFMALAFPNRRIRFARFNSKSGRPGLDIGCAGNDLPTFKAFVDQVRRRIAKA
jgi:hypothetical protein